MKRGRVIGEVWATRKAPGLDGQRMKLVALSESARTNSRVVVALDTLDARNGQEVLVAFGSGARNVLSTQNNRHLLCDAAIALLIEPEERGS